MQHERRAKGQLARQRCESKVSTLSLAPESGNLIVRRRRGNNNDNNGASKTFLLGAAGHLRVARELTSAGQV